MPGMLEHFGHQVHVAAADDRDVARVRVGEQRRVCQHLVVHVRVEVGHLHDAVEREHATEARRLEEHDLLELGAALLEHLRHVVAGLRRAARLVLFEPAGRQLGRHTAREVASVDALGLERVAEHTDDRFHVDVRAAREEVGGQVVVLGPRVEREVALGDHRDPGDAMRRELVDEHVDEGDVPRLGGLSERPLSHLHGVEMGGAPEFADCMPAES